MKNVVESIKKNKILFKAVSSVIDAGAFLKINFLEKAFWGICVLLPIHKKKILLSNFNGRGFADNQKYIALEILKRNMDWKMVWAVQKKDLKIPSQIKQIRTGSFAHIYHMATAKFWINNVRIASYFKKRKEQIYIQTWHAGLGYKKIEKALEEFISREYIEMAKRDSAAIDLILSNGPWMTQYFKEVFWYDGEFLEKGHPRNDILCQNQEKEKSRIRKALGLEEDRKIALYAPTFRANYKLDAYDLDYERALEALKKRFGGEWIMLVRLHPNLVDRFNELNLNSDNLVNASAYPDMQELLLVSDVMITDFTSAAFEFCLMEKPCFVYASDMREYMKDDRGLIITLDQVPFPQSESNKELAEIIEKYEEASYLQRIHAFMDEKQCDDGHAAEAVVDWMIKKVEK